MSEKKEHQPLAPALLKEYQENHLIIGAMNKLIFSYLRHIGDQSHHTGEKMSQDNILHPLELEVVSDVIDKARSRNYEITDVGV